MKNRLNSVVGVLAVLLLVCVFAISARAQLAGANLSGLVSDTSGSPVPDAKVSIKNVANGEVREVVTNGDGLYSAPNLVPGAYAR